MSLGAKEKAIMAALGPAMNLIDNWTKDIKPQNEVSQFVEQNLGIIFESQDQKLNPTLALLTKMAIAEANDNPEYVLNKLLRFYEALRVWYPGYREKMRADEAQKEPD